MVIDAELYAMQALNEEDFTKKYVIPLMIESGHKEVRYVHGNREFGRDVLCYDHDRFDQREDIGIQVKVGDIRGTTNIQEIISQAKAAYNNSFIDEYTHEERKICKLYIITSGKIPDYSIEQIHTGLEGYPRVHCISGTQVLDKQRKLWSRYFEYSSVEAVMSNISITSLLEEQDFLERAENMLKLLFDVQKVTPLQCITSLPTLLDKDTEIQDKFKDIDGITKMGILHWLSINLVLKAYYIYGKTTKFGLISEGA